MASLMAIDDLIMDGALDDGRRSWLLVRTPRVCLRRRSNEHARLPGFSARQGEQEVRGHGVGISGRRHASTPGSFAWLPSLQKKKKSLPPM